MIGTPAPKRPLDRLAAAAGIMPAFEGADGTERRTSDIAKRELLDVLGFATGSDAAIHAALASFETPPRPGGPGTRPRCFMPDWLRAGRCWGVTCQLYGLRSARNWGIGDFADLSDFGLAMAAEGASFVGVSPLHALFTADPTRISPYAPSSRRFLNPLFIATDWLDGVGEVPPARLRDGDLVDYARVQPSKLAALRRAFDRFLANHHNSGSRDDAAFAAYRAERGQGLRDFACFEALSNARAAARRAHASAPPGPAASGWHGWPAELRTKDGPAVAAFAETQDANVLFHMWLQWTAESQLRAVNQRLVAAGMPIGLYLDMAVGVAPDGAETWASPDATLPAARIGAPPDLFNPQGQDWGLAPLSPIALTNDRALYREMLSCNMQSAGAVRLDHVMALERLYLIPEGRPNDHGAYVRYPRDLLLGDLAELSHATATIVIGEDLGTVRAGFRTLLGESEIQSYRVLQFERTAAGRFKAPARWPRTALACFSTHDLATLRGWWEGADLAELARLGRIDPTELPERRRARAHDRRLLLAALERAHLAPPAFRGDASSESNDTCRRLAPAVHRYLAATPCRLLALQIEDLLGVREQANVPGTIDEHPNWRRRLPVAVDRIAGHHLFRDIVRWVATERPAPV